LCISISLNKKAELSWNLNISCFPDFSGSVLGSHPLIYPVLIIEKTFCFEVNMTDVYGILCVACLHFNFITNRFCCERIVWISTCPFNVGISIRNYILLVFLIHRMIHDIFNNWYSINKNGLQYIKLEAQVSMYRSPDINKSS
jgi:hypothetical protein